MRSISMRLAEMEKVKINIGYVGENEHTTVLIDCKKAFDEYPEAVASLTVRPPRGGEYPAVVVRNGNIVEWTVTDSDLIYAGNGEIQLTFTVGEVIVKTAIGTTVINRSLMRPGDIPTPIQNWIEQANQKIAAAEEATREAKAAAEHQPIIDDNGNWNTWDDDEGAYVDTGIKAQGEDGAPGRDGQDGQDGQDGKDGKDGQDGAPGQDGTDATPDLITVPYEDLTFPVAAGTKCYHDGKLYEANQAIQTSEQWTAAHWTETTVEEQLGQLKSALQAVENKFGTHYKDVTPERMYGKFWNSQGDTAVLASFGYYQAYYPVPVSPGDRCIISGYYGSSKKQHLALVVASDYTILQRIGTLNDREETHEVTIPENGAYVLMTTDQTTTYVSCYILVDNDIKQSVDGLFDFNGKNVAIIGDSISTNGDYSALNPLGNVPEIVITAEDVGVSLSAYATNYDVGTTVGGHEIVESDIGTEITFTPTAEDVGKVVGKPYTYNAASRVTWWEVAKEVLGFNPIPVCWSGASITSHEGSQDAYKTSYAWHPAQIRKCGIRIPGEMTRLSPDMIIIYRGTNDFSHSAYAKLTDGYFDNDSWTAPDTDVITGGFGFKEGLCLTIKKLREAYPLAKIVLCTMNFFKRVNYSTFPVNNGQNTENQFNDAIREVANYMGCGLIEFDKDGLTFENASNKYYVDQQTFTHPTDKGHKIIGNKAIRDLLKENAFLW